MINQMDRRNIRSLTIILPTKQEAANLAITVSRLRLEVGPYLDNLEILVVDANSQDGIDLIAKKLNVRLINLPKSTFGDAIRHGISNASHEWILTMDADGSHDPVYIPAMLRESNKAQIVVGARYVSSGGHQTSWFRNFTSRFLNYLFRVICAVPLHDVTGGFKLYHHSVFDKIHLESDGFEIQAECLLKAYEYGFVIKEIPFHYRSRLAGKSKVKLIKYGWAFLKSIVRFFNLRSGRFFDSYQESVLVNQVPLQKI